MHTDATYDDVVPLHDAARADAEPADEYWNRARLPVASLVFLAPLLILYEFGVLFVGGEVPDDVRNGADCWVRSGLRQLGCEFDWAPPLFVVAGLLFAQFRGRHSWRVSGDTLAGMLAESVLFAFVLIVLGQLQHLLFLQLAPPAELALGPHLARAVTYVGAGIYEEAVFRMALLPACYGLLRLSRLGHGWSTALAVLSTSLLFSLAHYLAGEPFALFTFVFRTSAGVFFAVLYVLRGFGITVGAHACYDLVVGVLMAPG